MESCRQPLTYIPEKFPLKLGMKGGKVEATQLFFDIIADGLFGCRTQEIIQQKISVYDISKDFFYEKIFPCLHALITEGVMEEIQMLCSLNYKDLKPECRLIRFRMNNIEIAGLWTRLEKRYNKSISQKEVTEWVTVDSVVNTILKIRYKC